MFQDAIYIETGGSHSYKKARHELVEALESVREGIDDKIHKMALKVVANSKAAIVDTGNDDVESEDGKISNSVIFIFRLIFRILKKNRKPDKSRITSHLFCLKMIVPKMKTKALT